MSALNTLKDLNRRNVFDELQLSTFQVLLRRPFSEVVRDSTVLGRQTDSNGSVVEQCLQHLAM